jgi:RNA polymerase sigma-70 factor (ECF subfamily)
LDVDANGLGLVCLEKETMNLSVHYRDDRHPGTNGKGDNARGHSNGNGNGESFQSPESSAISPPPGSAYKMRSTSNDPTDETLLDQYRQGDRGCFRKLVDRYQRELYHFLVRFLGDRAAAEDVFQETFLQVHQSAEQFDVNRRFRPWLFTIAANKARDLIRAQSRRPTNPLQASISAHDEESGEFIDLMHSAAELPSEPMERQELQQLVQNAVMSMPDNLREILLLSYFHQFPYKQISDILGIPLGTVKSRLHAAVAYFADRWRGANQSTSLS